MEKEERQRLAVEYHSQKFNCCQSVLLSCCDLTGMTKERAEAIGYCFASGMYSGEVCGAVTGGLMAIGSCLPGQDLVKNKRKAQILCKKYQEQFRSEFQSVRCREILKSHGGRVCDSCISCGAGIVNDLIEELRKEEEE